MNPGWRYITHYLESSVYIPLVEETKTNNLSRTHCWRELFRTLILVLYNIGSPPSESVGKEEKIREALKDENGSYVIENSY